MRRDGFLFLVMLFCLGPTGCQQPGAEGFFYGVLDSDQKLIIASSGTITGAPLVLSQYNLDGSFEKVLYDATQENRVLRSMAMVDPFHFLISTDTVDGILKYGRNEGISTFVANGQLNGNIYNLRRASNGDLFVIETARIESFNSAGDRIGNPRINTPVGSCVLSGTVRGMDVTLNDVVVVASQGNDAINFYDVSDPANTTCLAANTSMGNTNPIAVVAHSDGFVYVATTNGTDSILQFAGDGSGSGTTIYSATTAWNPTAMIEMPDGSLIVGSDGSNNIIRMDTSGNVLSDPFIQNGFASYVQDMMILDGI
ncbi:MAG: hypothetical protein AB7F86_08005 [Bdellovibrionales bacterium]